MKERTTEEKEMIFELFKEEIMCFSLKQRLNIKEGMEFSVNLFLQTAVMCFKSKEDFAGLLDELKHNFNDRYDNREKYEGID